MYNHEIAQRQAIAEKPIQLRTNQIEPLRQSIEVFQNKIGK